MEKNIFNRTAILSAVVLLAASCQKESTTLTEPQALSAVSAQKTNVFKGPVVQIGDGHARTWISITHEGVPIEMGVQLTASLESLPDHNFPMLLPLHQKAQELTAFDHVGFNYMNHGHFPPGVFDIPHFDVHFYMTSVEERLAIPAPGPTTIAQFMLPPAPGYLPATYTAAGPEAEMGLHWAPPPPTFMPFSRVMIYGTFNGEVTFLEPMVTIAHMASGGSTNTFLQPTRFAEAGYYPTMYNVYTDPRTGAYNVTLSHFVYRAAS